MENYNKFVIKKHFGKKVKYRTIYAPKEHIKEEQKRALNKLNYKRYKKLKPSVYAKAYRMNYNGIIEHIKPHKGNRFFLKLDFKKFFESITKDMTKKTHAKYLYRYINPKIIGNCFVNDQLVIGSVLAPLISNLVLKDFDYSVKHTLTGSAIYHLKTIMIKDWNPNLVYTRYADDMLISSKYKLNLTVIIARIKGILQTLGLPLKLNMKKTFSSDTAIVPFRVFGFNLFNYKIFYKRIRTKAKPWFFRSRNAYKGYYAWMKQVEKLAIEFNNGKKWWKKEKNDEKK